MKLIVYLLLVLFPLQSNSQNNDPDWKTPSWWKEKAKNVNEADSVTKINEDVQRCSETDFSSLLTMAIKPSLSVVRQQYRLKRKGEYYGKDNKSYYGETYSLGIKIPGGMYLLDKTINPWNYDSDFERANSSHKYEPSIFLSYQKVLTDSIFSPIDLEIGTEYVKKVNKNSPLYLHTEAFSDFGLSIDQDKVKKSGFMVLVYKDMSNNDKAFGVSIKTSCVTIDDVPNDSLLLISPIEAENLLGGVFVTTKVNKGGNIQFLLSGVVIHSKDMRWSLQLLSNLRELKKTKK